jgi:hypothetical protein
MPCDVLDQQSDDAGQPRPQRVTIEQYRELIVSSRRLDRVRDQPGWLRDRETQELFFLPEISDASVTQRV